MGKNNMCTFYRIVGPDLKSIATGLTSLVLAGLGMLPGPIIVGFIVDSSCRIWQKDKCGDKTFCQLYKTDDFRFKIHVAMGGVK